MSSLSPLDGRSLNSAASQLVMSSQSPLNWSMFEFHPPILRRLSFVVMFSSSPLNNKYSKFGNSQSVMSSPSPLNRWISNPLFFIVTFSYSPLNDKISNLIIPNLSCPVSHHWTDELLDLPFIYPQWILFPRLILSCSRLVLVLVLIPLKILLGEISPFQVLFEEFTC